MDALKKNTSEGTEGSNYLTRKPGGTAQAWESPWQWGRTGEMHRRAYFSGWDHLQDHLGSVCPSPSCSLRPCLNVYLRKHLTISGPDLYWALWVLLHHKQQAHKGFQRPDPPRNAGEQEPNRWGKEEVLIRPREEHCTLAAEGAFMFSKADWWKSGCFYSLHHWKQPFHLQPWCTSDHKAAAVASGCISRPDSTTPVLARLL